MIELWSSNHDAYSHRCRIVIEEKSPGDEQRIAVKTRWIDLNKKPEDLARINPLNRVPVLVNRDLHLYESNIISEYLDERFPHPQLMPMGVSEKARARLMLHRIDVDLYDRMDIILNPKLSKKKQDLNRQLLAESLLLLSQSIGKTKFFYGNDISMVDIALAPLLWRLKHLEVRLPPKAAPLLKYAETIFERKGFMDSLTAAERGMRK